jgi:hypothetical protein
MSNIWLWITRRAVRFYKWLFPEEHSETATCVECGVVAYKTKMTYYAPYGWFCNVEECVERWERWIWELRRKSARTLAR